MVKNVLVTDGAGYVGSPLVGVLLDNNYKVIVVDNFTFGAESLLSVWHHPNFKLIYGDIVGFDVPANYYKPENLVGLTLNSN